MPHNRAERQSTVANAYDFVVYGGEFSIFNALLITADAIILGGNTSATYLQNEMNEFGINLAVAMASAQPPINPATEPLYVGKFVFQNWEQPVPGLRIPLPNKFVPYVAARRRNQAPAPNPHIGDVPAPGNPNMTFHEKLANAFGHCKNARLLAQEGQVENQVGHVNWALGQAPVTVKNWLVNYLEDAINHLDDDPTLLKAANIFAYIKAARLVMQDPPITTAQESLEGHSTWAINSPLSAIRHHAHNYANALNNIQV